MDENASKIKKKILFGTIGCLIGSAVVLCATAAIVNLVTGAGYAASFRYPATYLVWVCLIAVGVAAVAIDIRVRGSRRVLKVNVDLENSHFMTRKEIRRNGGYTFTRLSQLNEVKDGVPIIAEKHKTISISCCASRSTRCISARPARVRRSAVSARRSRSCRGQRRSRLC